jgi:hypothetical protein
MSLHKKNSAIINYGNIKKIYDNVAGIVYLKEYGFFFNDWCKHYFQISTNKIILWKHKYKNRKTYYFTKNYTIDGFTYLYNNKKYYKLIIYEKKFCIKNNIIELKSHNFKGMQLIYNTIKKILNNL